MGRGREAATSPAGTPPAPLGGRGPLHPGYPSEVEDDRPSLTCPAAAVPADPQCQPGPALQPARSEPRGARDGPGDAGHRISALTRPRDPAARRPALPAPPEAPASPLAQAAGSPATTSAPRRKSRPRPPFQPRPSEVPPRACTRTGSPPSARVGGAARAGTWGSGGAVAVFCAGDCPPPPRGGARPKVSPEGPSRGLGVAGARREPTSAAPSTHCGGLPRGSSTPTGSRPSARVGGTADGRPALRAPRGRRAAGRDSSSRGCGRGFLSARAPDGGRTINISAYLQRMTHPLSFLKYLFAIG